MENDETTAQFVREVWAINLMKSKQSFFIGMRCTKQNAINKEWRSCIQKYSEIAENLGLHTYAVNISNYQEESQKDGKHNRI